MTITLNNNIKVNLDNNCKLIRWDILQTLQPEKIEILEKWFEITNYHPTKTSTPVVDITDGIVYARIGCGNESNLNARQTTCMYIKQSIRENIPYASKNKNPNVSHKTGFGKKLAGHRFISVADASVEYLEAIYAQYVENIKEKGNKKEKETNSTTPKKEKLPESNVSKVFNFHYSNKGNEHIKQAVEYTMFLKASLDKIIELQFGNVISVDFSNTIIEYTDKIKLFLDFIYEEEIIQIGGLKMSKKDFRKFLADKGVSEDEAYKVAEIIKEMNNK